MTDWENYKKLNNWDDRIEDFKNDLKQVINTNGAEEQHSSYIPFYRNRSIVEPLQYDFQPNLSNVSGAVVSNNDFYNYSPALNSDAGIFADQMNDLKSRLLRDVCFSMSLTEQKNLISEEQLYTMFPQAEKKLLDQYLLEFNRQLPEAGIDSSKRLAYFFATVNEETGGMTTFVENDFKYRDPQRAYNYFHHLRKDKGNNATMSHAENLKYITELGSGERFANVIYANMLGNGNEASGDGFRFRGRGLFHLTGKENYFKLGGKDFVRNPDLLLAPSTNVKVAIDYWQQRGLNGQVDKLSGQIFIPSASIVRDKYFRAVVYSINAGLSNINKRAASYNKYFQLFDNK